MRSLVIPVLLLTAACSFQPGSPPGSPITRDSSPMRDVPSVCGNGVIEPGEACEVGDIVPCMTSCGNAGTSHCNASCQLDACVIDVDPATAWQVSVDGVAWSSTALPNTNWGCTNCTRYFRTTVCDRPSSVELQWASDNKARMQVDGVLGFGDYWLPTYCTDAPCCTKCCDTTANCLANISTPRKLDAAGLALFHPGANEVRWEVFQEVGGSGFYSTMTLTY